MAGRLVYLMGPSGAGKDAVLQGLMALMGDKNCYLAPRLVTRPAFEREAYSVSVSAAEFQQLEEQGGLALAWRAHGLAYGVPSVIDERLHEGCDVLVNGSRGYLPEACRRYRNLLPVLLTVDSSLLRQRLSSRGREGTAQITERLERNSRFAALPQHAGTNPVVTIDNSGPIGDAIGMLYTYLKETRFRQEDTCG